MTTTTVTATERRLRPATLVGGAFALTTLLNIAIHVGVLLFTDTDPDSPTGPIASIKTVAAVGGVGLLLALAIAIPMSRDSQRARIGAVVLGVLAIVSLPVFWSGAPASLGAAAAWLGGFAKGSHPQTGIARGFGLVGIVIVILEIVATAFGGVASSLIN